jgi:hypothetical protein
MDPKTSPPMHEWRTLALNPAIDRTIFRSLQDSHSISVERGTDLLVHTAPSGTHYYYLWHWTMKPGETNIIQLITEDSAQIFLKEQNVRIKNNEQTGA